MAGGWLRQGREPRGGRRLGADSGRQEHSVCPGGRAREKGPRVLSPPGLCLPLGQEAGQSLEGLGLSDVSLAGAWWAEGPRRSSRPQGQTPTLATPTLLCPCQPISLQLDRGPFPTWHLPSTSPLPPPTCAVPHHPPAAPVCTCRVPGCLLASRSPELCPGRSGVPREGLASLGCLARKGESQ